MPFQSKAQMRKCFATKSPNWDCKKMYKDTKKTFKQLPEYKIHKGPKGGQYIIKKGRKIYLQKK